VHRMPPQAACRRADRTLTANSVRTSAPPARRPRAAGRGLRRAPSSRRTG
jgi:hypothetical protein